MRGRMRVPLFAVALALLGLIGLLATLQFHWLGQISDAERDRMRATLETGASAFARDFDSELTRAYLLFQIDPLGSAEDLPIGFAARYDRWHATSKYPRLVKHFYLFTSDGTTRLQKFDPSTRSLAAVDWPASMQDWRDHVIDTVTEPASSRGGDYFIRRIGSPVWESVPAIVVPSPLLPAGSQRPATGTPSAPRVVYTILEIDESYVSHEMLPALAEQHFTPSSGAGVQLAVVSRAGGRVIYHSSEAFNPAPGTHADATADLFAIRTQDFGRVASEIHRFVTFASAERLRSEKAAAAGSAGVVPDNRPVIVVERAESGTALARPGQAQTTTMGLTRVTPTLPSWQLILAHQSGSLEAAVAVARRRNLLVSSSILGVLGASMALLLLATRRAQRLAQQQMEFVATVSARAPDAAGGHPIRRREPRRRHRGRRVAGEEVRRARAGRRSAPDRHGRADSGVLGNPVRRTPAESPLRFRSRRSCAMFSRAPRRSRLPPGSTSSRICRTICRRSSAMSLPFAACSRISWATRSSTEPPAAWIRIDARRQGNEVLVTVSDRGIGIDPSDHERIFDPFYRAAAVVEAQIQGAGLGLSLVKRIVEAHGGAISVRSAPGAGAAFTVRLPIASSEPARRVSGFVRRSASPQAGTGAKAPRYS